MYRHFLNRNDYLSIITETALNQLVRDNKERFTQAEQIAEATILDYLSENYEVEREFDRGKYIIDYDKRISYPVGVFFYHDNKICEVIKAINGYKEPENMVYWELKRDLVENPETVRRYSQVDTYQPGDIVMFRNEFYECVNQNGYDFSSIRIPGFAAWKRVEAPEWEAKDYQLWDVVKYAGAFFTLMNDEGESFQNPMESDSWGMIANYSTSVGSYELNEHEYVVYEDNVYYPVMNPNADSPQIGINIRYNDPRNFNLKRHMVQLALYELHKLVSPNNVSNVRISDYDHSISWLRDASRLKLNPQIPRKLDKKDNKPVTDWQMATFQASYDPYNNPWHI